MDVLFRRVVHAPDRLLFFWFPRFPLPQGGFQVLVFLGAVFYFVRSDGLGFGVEFF